MHQADIIIQNGQILTMNPSMDIVNNGVVVIKESKIIDIGNQVLLNNYSSPKIIDAENGIVMPGMVNTHCHLPMIAFRGLGEEGGIENRLLDYFLPLENQLLSRDLIYKATLHGCLDMILSGVTTFADMYYHVDEMAKAVHRTGLRAVLGQTVVGFPVVDAKKAYDGLKYIENIIDEFKDYEIIQLAIAPHAPYSVNEQMLKACNKLAEKFELLVHIHAAEFIKEPSLIKDNHKKLSTIGYLNDIGFLNSNVLLAHCNHISEEDIKIITSNKSRIAHNPLANMKGATGMSPIHEMLHAGIKVGLGTDGPMGSNVIDLFKVMTFTACVQRIRMMDESIAPPEQIVRMSTLGGAEALDLNEKIGSIEVGKLADIIIVETDSLNMVPNYNPYATLVYQANPHNVSVTIVNGRVLAENRNVDQNLLVENKNNMESIIHSTTILGNNLSKIVRHTNA